MVAKRTPAKKKPAAKKKATPAKKKPAADPAKGGTPTQLPELADDILLEPMYRKLWDMHVRAGTPLPVVAKQLDIHRTTAWRMLQKILTEGVPALDEDEVNSHRQIQLARIDERNAILTKAMMQTASPTYVTVTDDKGNETRVEEPPDHLGLARLNAQLKANEDQRARLLGTLAPKEINITGVSTDPLGDEIRKFRSQLERVSTPEDIPAS